MLRTVSDICAPSALTMIAATARRTVCRYISVAVLCRGKITVSATDTHTSPRTRAPRDVSARVEMLRVGIRAFARCSSPYRRSTATARRYSEQRTARMFATDPNCLHRRVSWQPQDVAERSGRRAVSLDEVITGSRGARRAGTRAPRRARDRPLYASLHRASCRGPCRERFLPRFGRPARSPAPRER